MRPRITEPEAHIRRRRPRTVDLLEDSKLNRLNEARKRLKAGLSPPASDAHDRLVATPEGRKALTAFRERFGRDPHQMEKLLERIGAGGAKRPDPVRRPNPTGARKPFRDRVLKGRHPLGEALGPVAHADRPKGGRRQDSYDAGGNLRPQFKDSGKPLTSLAARHPAATGDLAAVARRRATKGASGNLNELARKRARRAFQRALQA